jgi:hypothetical protein
MSATPTQPRLLRSRRANRAAADIAKPRYKWVVLSNTTLGILMATINASILLIALPDIGRRKAGPHATADPPYGLPR